MKTPTLLKVFAFCNLIIALTGMTGTAYFIYELSYNYDNPAYYIMVFCMAAGSAWLLFASLSWLFSFQTANVLIFTSVLSIITFLGAVLEASIQLGLQSKVQMQMLSLLFIGFGTYTLFLVSSIFFKPVREWRAAHPEMRWWTWPMLTLFLVMMIGGLITAVTLRPADPLQQAFDTMNADTTAVAAEENYPAEPLPAEGYINEITQDGIQIYFDEGYQSSSPYEDQSPYQAPQGGQQLNTPDISQALTSLFESSTSNEWDTKNFRQDNVLQIYYGDDQQYGFGMYLAGPFWLREKLFEHFSKTSNLPDKGNCYWHCYLENLSGINPILAEAGEQEKFNRYNPEFIRWVYTYAIPEPTTELLNGVTAGQIYAKVFRRFFRIYTLAWCHLQLSNLYEDQENYQRAATAGQNFDGISYLRERYNGVLPNYASQDYYSQLEPALAIGFWLRRGIDGTEKDCWLGLQKAMNKYDPIWFHKTLVEYGLQTTPQ